MDILKAIKNRRTIRQFQAKEIPAEILKNLIDAARLAPSAMNLQPLEYIVVNDSKLKDQVFQSLSFGGKLPEEQVAENRKAAAYIIVLTNNNINSEADIDAGLAVENLVLAAYGQNLGSCILGSVNAEKIRTLFKIPENFEIKLTLALGYPAEKSQAEDAKDETTEYRRDSKGILHVPKRKLAKIIHINKFWDIG